MNTTAKPIGCWGTDCPSATPPTPSTSTAPITTAATLTATTADSSVYRSLRIAGTLPKPSTIIGESTNTKNTWALSLQNKRASIRVSERNPFRSILQCGAGGGEERIVERRLLDAQLVDDDAVLGDRRSPR